MKYCHFNWTEIVAESEGKKKYITVAVSLVSVMITILTGMGFFLYIRKRLSYQNLRMKGEKRVFA